MLTATRDPRPDREAPTISHGDIRPLGAPGHSHSARMLSAVQLTGAVLAIPVALASAYSVYQANFSPDVQCQTLRAGIISMIDKKIDAPTRRMLVRRDVETFEKACASFDPDARAAFADLVAEPRVVTHVPVTPKAEPKVEARPEPLQTEAKAEPAKAEPPKDVVRKAEPKPAQIARTTPAVTEVDTTTNDARWLEAVRGALVAHGEPASLRTTAPAAQPLGRMNVPAEPVVVAPALPPAAAVPVPPPSQFANDPNRPVPPAAIPEADPRNNRSSWVSDIPFVGKVLDK